jgi:hypothetical protein
MTDPELLIIRDIYIKLFEEGTDVYRPTKVELISEGIFRVLPTENYDSDDEIREFIPGTIVSCKEKSLTSGITTETELVAINKISEL